MQLGKCWQICLKIKINTSVTKVYDVLFLKVKNILLKYNYNITINY